MNCQNCGADLCVSRVPIFNHLDVEYQIKIMDLSVTKHYKKNEMIFNAGDVSDSLFIINSGKVKVFSIDESGKEHLISILNPGDYIGETSLFLNESQHHFASALEDTKICLIYKSDIMRLLSEYPTIAIKILEEFAKRLDKSQTQAKWLGTSNATSRLSKYLIDNSTTKDGLKVTKLKMARKDLANYLGMSPETLSRVFKALEEKGSINQKSSRLIEINNLDYD
ncbi:MAG: Crp/Fnr family transcriptional regulator [Erysipelothrix sp.]|nr:Crp/Fnr family transcriptional regulator [Erysipelothrix sp.]